MVIKGVYYTIFGLFWCSVVKNPPANAGDTGSIPGSGKPLEKEMAIYPSNTPVVLPGKSHGQRSLVGYSRWRLQRVRQDLTTEHQQHYTVVRSPVYSPRVSGFFVVPLIQMKSQKQLLFHHSPLLTKKGPCKIP